MNIKPMCVCVLVTWILPKNYANVRTSCVWINVVWWHLMTSSSRMQYVVFFPFLSQFTLCYSCSSCHSVFLCHCEKCNDKICTHVHLYSYIQTDIHRLTWLTANFRIHSLNTLEHLTKQFNAFTNRRFKLNI